MRYENKSRSDLIDIIDERNKMIEDLNNQLAMAQKKIDEMSSDGIAKLVNDLKKQRKCQSDIIMKLREGKAGLMRIVSELDKKIK